MAGCLAKQIPTGARLPLIWLVLCVCTSAVAAGPPSEVPAPEPIAAPRIEFDSVTADLGTIYQREKVHDAFVFRNAGDATLKIEKVRSTCGCTAALPAKREIAPGEEGEIAIRFSAGLMRGRVVKHVYVETNDPVHPRVDLTLIVRIKVELEVVPHGIYVGKLTMGELVERSISLYSPEVPAFSILEVSAADAAIQVAEPVRVAGEKNRYRIDVRFGPANELGRITSRILLRTDLPHSEEVPIRVFGNVVRKSELSEPAETRALPQ